MSLQDFGLELRNPNFQMLAEAYGAGTFWSPSATTFPCPESLSSNILPVLAHQLLAVGMAHACSKLLALRVSRFVRSPGKRLDEHV